jgi:hypothetical protein
VAIYWVGLGVTFLAFVLSWFFKPPPPRTRSAAQERADPLAAAGELEAGSVYAAEAGSRTAGGDGTVRMNRQ